MSVHTLTQSMSLNRMDEEVAFLERVQIFPLSTYTQTHTHVSLKYEATERVVSQDGLAASTINAGGLLAAHIAEAQEAATQSGQQGRRAPWPTESCRAGPNS